MCFFVLYRSVVGNVEVKIDSSECIVSTVTDNEIVCVTGPHIGSIETKVEVQISGNGIAGEVDTCPHKYSFYLRQYHRFCKTNRFFLQ